MRIAQKCEICRTENHVTVDFNLIDKWKPFVKLNRKWKEIRNNFSISWVLLNNNKNTDNNNALFQKSLLI